MNKEDLEYDISIALDRWDHESDFTLAGVTDISKSDLDVLMTCCDVYDQYGTLKHAGLYSEKVREVLSHYGMLFGTI